METSNITNKIISIVVALVVATMVLIPICNSFASDSGGSEGESVVWHNTGVPMSPIDINDHSKEYVFTKDDVANLMDRTPLIVGFKIGEIVDGYMQVSSSLVYCYPQTHPDSPFSDGDGYNLKLYWNEEQEIWCCDSSLVQGYISTGGINQVSTICVYDPDSEYRVLINELDSENEENINLSDLRFSEDEPYIIIGEMDGYDPETEMDIFIQFRITNEDIEFIGGLYIGEEEEYEIVSAPKLGIDANGKLITGDIFIDYNGQIINQKQLTHMEPTFIGDMAILVPATVTISSNDGGSSGTVGTLIQLIPLFVILAILLSVVTLMTGRTKNSDLI